MKLTAIKLFLLLFLFIGFTSKAQTTKDFEQDFQRLATTGFPKKDVDSLFKKYNHLLFFFNSNSRLAAAISQKVTHDYPLASFKSHNLYQQNIDLLLLDTVFQRNSLGYFMAAATNDTSKIKLITSILIKSDYKNFWAANILMVLKSRDITPLVKTIVKFKDKNAVSYLIDPFLQLDLDVIEPFALDSIKSKNSFVQYLAIRAMAKGKFSPTKEELLRNVVTNGPDGLKGWGISVLASFGASNMLNLVQPYLNNTDLRQISISAMVNSSSARDEQYVDELLKRDSVNSDLLLALMESTREQSVRKWFMVLRDHNVPKDYFPFITDSSIRNNDMYFDDICETILKAKSQSQIYPLYDFFSSRDDEKSIHFLLKCLAKRDQHSMVKHAIIKNLKGKNNDLVKQALPDLMKNADASDIQLVYLLIEYKNSNYHELVRTWLKNGNLETAYVSLCNEYLNSQ